LKHINNFIVNIDGSSGSGKSTAAKLIAKKFNWSVLYSGLLFRFAAKKIIEKNPKDKILYLKKIFKTINYNKIKQMNLHKPEISSFSAVIAKELKVRQIIKTFQKKYVKQKKTIVLEGRDMSKIFHNADIKFYIVCIPLKIAAKRRWLQLKKGKKNISLEKVLKDLKKRDFMDRNRKHSPLERHANSVYINTAKLNIKAVLDKMTKIIERKIRNKYGS
jgi:cytidylate kinase